MPGSFINPPYTPQNEVYTLKGIELSNNYQDTYLFDSINAQTSFFTGKANESVDHYTNVTPFKISDGFILLPNTIEHFNSYNYLMMKNADMYSGKWYYAFITSCEMVNPGVTRINFELDVIQTYQFNWNLHQCFIERCHELTDSPGSNILDEGLELGEYIINDAKQTDKFDDYTICVACTMNSTLIDTTGGYFNGQYSGLNIISFDSASEVNDFISSATEANKLDGIVAIFQMPSNFVRSKSNTPSTSSAADDVYTYNVTSLTLDGYTPKNKKLLTYPYKFLHVTNFMGNSADYHYEWFSSRPLYPTTSPRQVKFELRCSMEINPTVKIIPTNYNGMDGTSIGTLNNVDYGLTLSGFPQCSWVSDTYKAWVAQQGTVSAFGMDFSGVDLGYMSQGLGVLGSALSLNVGGVASGILGIAQTMAKQNATKSLPPQAHGENANGALFQFGLKDFGFQDMSIRQSYARAIDGYFDMFGYSHKHTESPVTYLNSRPFWNYIKTQGILISGNFNNDVARKLESIFNNGVRFWHGDYIGNYSLNNAPQGG